MEIDDDRPDANRRRRDERLQDERRIREEAANSDRGEDEVGALDDGDDSGIHDDHKPITGNSAGSTDDSGSDRHKTDKLTKAGRDIDSDDGLE